MGPNPVNRGDEFAARKRSLNVVSSSGFARATDVGPWLAESTRLAVDLVVVASRSGGARRDDRQSHDTRCDGG
jgi:hypothetical protein